VTVGRQGGLKLAHPFFDLVVEVSIAVVRLGAFSGRILCSAIGITPSREIIFPTGLGL
jgi:hypothetical protein